MLLPCLSLLSDQPTRDSSSHGSKCHNCSGPVCTPSTDYTNSRLSQLLSQSHSGSAMSNFNIGANIFERCFCFLFVQALHDNCHVWTAVIITRKNSWTWWEKWISSCVIPYMHQWPPDELCQTHADACFIPAPGWFCSLSVTRCAASAPQLSKTGCVVLTTTFAHTFPPLHPTFSPPSARGGCSIRSRQNMCAASDQANPRRLPRRLSPEATHSPAGPNRNCQVCKQESATSNSFTFLKWCVHWRKVLNSH